MNEGPLEEHAESGAASDLRDTATTAGCGAYLDAIRRVADGHLGGS